MDIIFLREFTKEIILNSRKKLNLDYVPQKIKLEEEIPNIESIMYSAIKTVEKKQEPKIKQEKRTIFYPKIIPIRQPAQITQKKEIMHESMMSAGKTQPQLTKPAIKPLRIEISEPPQQTIEQIAPSNNAPEINLNKLNYLLSDLKITRIECQGPGKKILVTKMGRTNITDTILTEEEILEIIKTFAEMTSIPLIGGVFKAAYKNLHISALLAEGETKFIIDKISPFALIKKQSD